MAVAFPHLMSIPLLQQLRHRPSGSLFRQCASVRTPPQLRRCRVFQTRRDALRHGIGLITLLKCWCVCRVFWTTKGCGARSLSPACLGAYLIPPHCSGRSPVHACTLARKRQALCTDSLDMSILFQHPVFPEYFNMPPRSRRAWKSDHIRFMSAELWDPDHVRFTPAVQVINSFPARQDRDLHNAGRRLNTRCTYDKKTQSTCLHTATGGSTRL